MNADKLAMKTGKNALTAATMAQQAQHQHSNPNAATKVFSTFELLEPILIYASESKSRKSMQLLLSIQRVCKSAYDTVKISKPLQQRLWYSPPGIRGAVNPLFTTPSNRAPFFITGGSLSDAKSITVRSANIAWVGGTESWRKMIVLSDAEVYTVWMSSRKGMSMFRPKSGKSTMTGEELLLECARLKGADTTMEALSVTRNSYPGTGTTIRKRKARRSRY